MRKDKYGNDIPLVGDTIRTDRGPARVLQVHPFGTVDVEFPSGQCYRITGLSWILPIIPARCVKNLVIQVPPSAPSLRQ